MVKPPCLTNMQISVSGDIGTKVASKRQSLEVYGYNNACEMVFLCILSSSYH
jgi:hypothetical protein